MKKWEYRILNAYDLGSSAPFNSGVLQIELDRLGNEGWEGWGGQYPNLFFKRPKMEVNAGFVPHLHPHPILRLLREREELDHSGGAGLKAC